MENNLVLKVEEMEGLLAPKALLVQGGTGPVMTADQEVDQWLWDMGL